MVFSCAAASMEDQLRNFSVIGQDFEMVRNHTQSRSSAASVTPSINVPQGRIVGSGLKLTHRERKRRRILMPYMMMTLHGGLGVFPPRSLLAKRFFAAIWSRFFMAIKKQPTQELSRLLRVGCVEGFLELFH